jgi:hypothetical protein
MIARISASDQSTTLEALRSSAADEGLFKVPFEPDVVAPKKASQHHLMKP